MKQILPKIAHAVGNLHVTTKLMASFGLMVALTILISYVGVRSEEVLNLRMKSQFNEDLTGISAIKEAGIFQSKCTRALRDLVLSIGDKESIDEHKQVLSELESSVEEWLGAAQQALPDQQSQAKLKEIKLQTPALRQLSVKVGQLVEAGDQKGAMGTLRQTNTLTNRINLEIAEICRLREAAAKNSWLQCEQVYRRSRDVMAACTIFATLFAGMLCFLTVSMIAGPLVRVMATLKKASDGDLTQRLEIPHRDEIGEMGLALNEALESTRTVLQQVRETAGDLGVLSNNLSTAAQGLARGARAQAASLEETSASLEEITSSARNNAEHARQANNLAVHSRDVAQKGHTVVSAAVHAMQEINDSSETISQIASAMDEVAFQTNMLSVNAAIEAARAGENGRSFGVVAEEIRSLANRSAGSAREIRKLIQDSLTRLENGSSSIHTSGETLTLLSSSVTEVTDYVTQIMGASEEQSQGVEQVLSAILQMDKVTQANQEQAADLTATATALSAQAARLTDMLDRFTLETAQT